MPANSTPAMPSPMPRTFAAPRASPSPATSARMSTAPGAVEPSRSWVVTFRLRRRAGPARPRLRRTQFTKTAAKLRRRRARMAACGRTFTSALQAVSSRRIHQGPVPRVQDGPRPHGDRGRRGRPRRARPVRLLPQPAQLPRRGRRAAAPRVESRQAPRSSHPRRGSVRGPSRATSAAPPPRAGRTTRAAGAAAPALRADRPALGRRALDAPSRRSGARHESRSDRPRRFRSPAPGTRRPTLLKGPHPCRTMTC